MALSSGLIEKLRYELAIDGSGAKKHAASMGKVFKNLNKTALLAAGAVAAIGLVGAAFIAKGLSAAIKYEKAWAEVATILNATAGAQKALNHEVEKLSTLVPESAVSLAKGLYQTISSGITEASEALEVLDVSARLATAGLTDSFTAVDTITTILNAFDKEVSEAEKVADILFTTVREGKLTFTTLAGSIGKAIPFFAQSGLAVEELTAAMATLTKGGLQADIASTALRATVTQIIKPSQDAQKIAAALGLELNATALKTKGLVGFLQELKTVTQADAAILSQLFPNVRGLAAVLALAGNQNEEYNRILGVTIEAEGSMNRAFLTMNDTIASQAKILENKGEKKWVEFGNTFMKTAKQIIAAFSGISQTVEEQAQGTERLVERYTFLKDEVPELVERYKVLAENTKRNTKEEKEFREIIEEVTGAFPRLIGEIDEHGRALSLNIPLLRTQTDLLRQQLIASEDVTFGALLDEYKKVKHEGEEAMHAVDNFNDSVSEKPVEFFQSTGHAFSLTKGFRAVERAKDGTVLLEVASKKAKDAALDLGTAVEFAMDLAQEEAEEASFKMRGFERIIGGMVQRAGLEEQIGIWRDFNTSVSTSEKETTAYMQALKELSLVFPKLFRGQEDWNELLVGAADHLADIAEKAQKAKDEITGLFERPEIAGALEKVLGKESDALERFTKFINEELGVEIDKKTVGVLAVLPDQRAQKIIDEWKAAYQDFTDFATKQNKAAIKDYEKGIKTALNVAQAQQDLGLPISAVTHTGGPRGMFVATGDEGRSQGADEMAKLTAQFRLNFEKVTDAMEVSMFKLLNGFGDFETELGKLPPKIRKRMLEVLKSLALSNPAQFTKEQLEAIRSGLGELGEESEKDLTQVQVFTQGLRDLGSVLGGTSAIMASFISSLNNFVAAMKTGLTTLQSVSAGIGLLAAGAAIGQAVVGGRAREEAARQAKIQQDFAQAVDRFDIAVKNFTGQALTKLMRAIAKFVDGGLLEAGESLKRLPRDNRQSTGRGEIQHILDSLKTWLDSISGIASVSTFATIDDWLKEAKANGSDLIKELIETMGDTMFTGAGMQSDELALLWFEFFKSVEETVNAVAEQFARFDKSTFTGVMKFLKFEFDQFDITDPAEQIARIIEELLKFSEIDLSFLNDLSPKEMEKAIEAITKLVTGDFSDFDTLGDLALGTPFIKDLMAATGMTEEQVLALVKEIREGNLSSDEVIALLENIEGINDEMLAQAGEIGEDNLAISRNVSITEQQGVTLISLSNTIVLILRNLEEKVATMTDAIVGAMDNLASIGTEGGVLASVTLPTIINLNFGGNVSEPEKVGRQVASVFVDDVEARLRAKGIKMIGQKR